MHASIKIAATAFAVTCAILVLGNYVNQAGGNGAQPQFERNESIVAHESVPEARAAWTLTDSDANQS